MTTSNYQVDTLKAALKELRFHLPTFYQKISKECQKSSEGQLYIKRFFPLEVTDKLKMNKLSFSSITSE